MTETTVGEPLRRILFSITLLSILGAGVELFLLGHTEMTAQWIPVGLLAVAVLALCWTGISGSALCVRICRWSMALCVAGGFVGLFLHYRSNVEFELEMYPSSRGWELFSGAMTGAIPALAPGVMIQIGLVGLAYTFRHPALNTAPRLEMTYKGERK